MGGSYSAAIAARATPTMYSFFAPDVSLVSQGVLTATR